MTYILRPNSTRKKCLEAALEKIVQMLPSTDVVLAIVFGSCASGNVGPGSDLDILLVRPTKKRFVNRAADLEELFDSPVGLDLLIYTPEEFAIMKQENPFVQHAVNTGKVIYETES